MSLTFQESDIAQLVGGGSIVSVGGGANPRAALVLIAQSQVSVDVTGVTYGGVAMDPVSGSPELHENGSEDATLYGYFLGSGIPTGNQDVVVASSGFNQALAAVILWTGDYDTAVEDTSVLDSAGVSDPSVTLTTTVETVIAGILHSGLPNEFDIDQGASYTDVGYTDFVLQVANCQRGTAPFAAGSPVCDWNANSDEAGILAVAIRETVPNPSTGSSGAIESVVAGLHATIDGRPIQLEDWTAETTANWGHRSLTARIPKSVTWAEQDAPVSIWIDDNTELWAGKLTQDPRDEHGVRFIRAEGYANDISAARTRMFYRTDGGAEFRDGDSDPYNYTDDDGFEMRATGGKIQFKAPKGEDFASGQVASQILWLEGATFTRYAFILNKNRDLSNFNIRGRAGTGPSGSLTTIDTYTLGGGNPSGTSVVEAVDNDYDLLALQIHCDNDVPTRHTLQTSAAADDIIDCTGHGFSAGDPVVFFGLVGGAGLSTGEVYYVISANLTANTFQVSASRGGSAVNFTTNITDGNVRTDRGLTERLRTWLTQIKVYGRTNDDAFSASDVVVDVGNDAGFDTDLVSHNGLGVLPLDWTEDHTNLLSYMAELTDWCWTTRGPTRQNGSPGIVFEPWEETWTAYLANDVVATLEPMRRYNRVRVPYSSLSGAYREAEASPEDDPFPDREVVIYADHLENPQSSSDLALSVAGDMVEHHASKRTAGRVQLGRVLDSQGIVRSAYKVKPGSQLLMPDSGLGPQRIQSVTYKPNSDVSVDINGDFNVVRLLAELKGDRPSNRRKKRNRRRL